MSAQLFFECIRLWWGAVSYSTWMYFALFLPIVMLIYQLSGVKERPRVLLGASWFFFFSLSGFLLLYNIASAAISYFTALTMQKVGEDKSLKRKERAAKKKRLLAVGIILNLVILIVLKYLDFLGLNAVRLFALFGISYNYVSPSLAVPIGISYYTLEAIAYMTDVCRENIGAERDFFNLALHMSFFPRLFEGPISRYSEDAPALFSGRAINYENLTAGYQRIVWGLFQKLVIADHLAPAVDILYQGNVRDGSVSLAAAIAFTFQEYMDFSGSIDIAIGSARVFGVVMCDNFRQPFFAKNASDFWHRWHITLGTWFRDYIFYPVSIAKPVMKLTKRVKDRLGMSASRLVGPAIALLAVWLSNGLWHGPRWTYIFYGLYYFVFIFLETLLEEPVTVLYAKLKLTDSSVVLRVFRFCKLFCIVITGEMFFRAETFETGWRMFREIFTNFHLEELTDHLGDLGMDYYDYWTVAVGLIIVLIVGIIRERGVMIGKKIAALPTPARFAFWYLCIFVIIIFGAYGSGYDAAGMIYAKF